MIRSCVRLLIGFILGLVVGASEICAQDSLWCATFGGYFNESGYAATRSSNGDFLLLGSTYSYGSGSHDIYLIRVDSAGEEIWSRMYGGTGADYGYDITPTSDEGYVIVGSTCSFGQGKHDVYVLKIDYAGAVVWSKTYGGIQDDVGASVRMTVDGGFIICGTTSSFGSSADIYLLKIDSLGDSSWTKTYGGPAGESGSAVRVLPDNGYAIVGSTGSYGAGYSSIYLIRTDVAGDTLWTATYGGNRADFGYGIETTGDRGYILAGATAPDGENFYDAFLVKVDSLGLVQWSDTYGGIYEDRGYSVKPTYDGGYIMAGIAESSSARKIDVYLVKTDGGGNIEWDSAYGGAEPDYGRMVLLDPNNDYYVVGHSFSPVNKGSDVCLLKVEGPIKTDADGFDGTGHPDRYVLDQNYPNPFNSVTTIEYRVPARSRVTIEVFNVLGQKVKTLVDEDKTAGPYMIDWKGDDATGRPMATGVYLYRFQARNQVQTKKMLLMK